MKNVQTKLMLLAALMMAFVVVLTMSRKPASQASSSPVSASGLTQDEVKQIHGAIVLVKPGAGQSGGVSLKSGSNQVHAYLSTGHSDNYTAYLFVTGASTYCAKITGVYPPGYYNRDVVFTNVPTGRRYFIRMVNSYDCTVGGQTNDNYFAGGNMGLGTCYCTPGWTSGCPAGL